MLVITRGYGISVVLFHHSWIMLDDINPSLKLANIDYEQ
jgi:hypothetical protein